MYGVVRGMEETLRLQATLSASSAMAGPPGSVPHHPITCYGDLAYEEDGSFRCEHVSVGPDDLRTRYCIDHSIALLLVEIAKEKFG